MEKNTDRMGFSLVALSVVSFVLLAVNGPLKASADSLFSGLQSWQKSTFSQIFGNNTDETRPNPDDSKWISKSNYGVNGKLLIDKDGNGVIYAIDASKPIEVNGSNETNEFFPTSELDTVAHLTFVSKVVAKGAIANSSVFGWGSTLESISGLELWNTTNVVSMNGLFGGLKKVTSIDGYQNWDTSNVTMMANLFLNDANLKSVDLSKWNTSKVTTMSGMFSSTTALTSVNLSNIDLRRLRTMDTMFMSSGVKSVMLDNVDAAPSDVSKDYAFTGLSPELASVLNSSLISSVAP